MFMVFPRQIACSLQKFADDTRGAILPIFAVMSLVVIVVAGAGIDYGRAINDREVMVNALDAAALAVAAELSTTIMSDDEIEEMLEEVFAANLDSLGLSAAAVSNMDFTVDPDEGVVSVSTSISVPTYFIGLGGIGPDYIDVAGATEVNYSKFDVELALILDVTGSMKNDIDSLQEAAQELLDTLIPDDTSDSDSKVRISIVPYSQGVNLGSYADDVTDDVAGNGNCVTERPGAERFTDAIYNYDGEDSLFFKGAGDALIYNGYESSPWGEACPDEKLIPLTSDREVLSDAIEDLAASGGTAGQTGISWGWYTLSPNWASLWPSDSAPAEYSDDDVLKFAIVMTDGDFNNYFDEVETTVTEEDCNWELLQRKNGKYKWKYVCTETETTEDVWTEDYNEDATISDESAVRGLKFCEQMASNNIEVFTIYFETAGSDFGEELMEQCASEDSNFYFADSQNELVNAFGNIAKKIQSIYLAK
ncbi:MULTISPECIES: pilus assembly protein TadG-related protein [Alphaproteobacteria]|uniref:pilus assembly protein TadG-related protein n=1 Tax=Alphaproteobacteria TaxID=28211 RepID=UPI003267ED4B